MTTPARLSLALLLLLFSGVPHRPVIGGAPVARGALALDAETVAGRRHYSSGYPARTLDGSVLAVVEIPTGTTAKFEVDESDGKLRWVHNREDGGRREVDYLGYPANYGMVPSTLAADGDPIDALVLGRGIGRGAVATTRIIGVLKIDQNGVRDDKLIAVPVDPELRNGFSDLRDLPALDARYPGTRAILELWFTHCWGRDTNHIAGWGDAAEAEAILEAAVIRDRPRVAPPRPGAPDPRPRAALPSARPGR